MARATPIKGIGPHTELAEAARLVVRARAADVATWAEQAGAPTAVEELHSLRIAAKRLRYSLELLQPALPRTVTALLDAVEEMQERLGAIHDDDVLLEMLRRRAGISAMVAASARAGAIMDAHGSPHDETGPPAELGGLYALLATVARRRHANYSAYREWWMAQGDLLDRLSQL